jgi:release factor glutamine methyltransferase
MHSYQSALLFLRKQLETIYDSREAAAIADQLMEHITGLDRLQRLSLKEKELSESQQQGLENAIQRLIQGEPLQHITGVQWFLGYPFKVNKHVLIPRPETEELVDWIIKDRSAKNNISILDIGTGSGCIPISLSLKIPSAIVTTCDISPEAIEVASENAEALKASVSFLHVDFLERKEWEKLELYDVIVSNPPYIPVSEKETLDKNVRDFEPGTALFVPSDDPLLFYKAIADFGKNHLKKSGAVYCELHRDYARQVFDLFLKEGYNETELRNDMAGNPRMIKAVIK